MKLFNELKRGASGEMVTAVKERLLRLGCYDPRIQSLKNNRFGDDTERAVKRFQMAAGLAVDGVIGEKTYLALFSDRGTAKKTGVEPSERALRVVSLARERIGDIYVWGASGQSDLSDAYIRSKDDAVGAERSIRFRNRQKENGFKELMAHDCSGLISWLLRETGIWEKRRDCDGLWRLSQEISKQELIPGDLLFRFSNANPTDATHVGLYCGCGAVIHAKGRDMGVVFEGIDENGSGYWHKFARCSLLYQEGT